MAIWAKRWPNRAFKQNIDAKTASLARYKPQVWRVINRKFGAMQTASLANVLSGSLDKV